MSHGPSVGLLDLLDLRAGAVHLWWFDTDTEAAIVPEEVLEDAERSAAKRFRDPVDAARFRARRGALRAILAGYTRRDPSALQFDRTCRHCGKSHGKPRLMENQEPLQPSPLQFNTSHAGGLGVVAVAWHREVGVDVEVPERAEDVEDVSLRFFSVAEQALLAASGSASEWRSAFLQAWSAKEAYGKLRGHGLALALEQLDTASWQGEAVPDPLGPGLSFRLQRPAIPGHSSVGLALALDGPEPALVRVFPWPQDSTGVPSTE